MRKIFNTFLCLFLLVESHINLSNLYAMKSEKELGKAPATDEQADPYGAGTSASATQRKSFHSDSCFVANIPAYVPSDSETDDTDSEPDDAKCEFSEEEFLNPPFKIDYEKRGKCLPSFTNLGQTSFQSPCTSKQDGIVEALTQKLSREAFAPGCDQTSLAHLAVVIGLNRPRSLSALKNRTLTKELEKAVDSKLTVQWFAMFWDFPWERTDKTKYKSRSNPPAYEEVVSFYRQLKRKNPKQAKQFRRETENNKTHSRRRMVPYRSIRELVKNHPFTTDLIHLFRKNNPSSNIYLFFCDADTTLFNGCFSVYTQLSQQTKKPMDVMTSGYLFDSENKMIKLACELDMKVREATAKYFPQGVYYPEPSFCILVLPEKSLFLESFEDGKPDYESPQESPIILKQVSLLRQNASFAFVFQNPLHTRTPDRATTNKAQIKNLLVFSAIFDESTNKFNNWTMQDLINITKNSAQSHAHGRSWAINVLNGLKLHTKGTVQNKIKKIFFPDGTYIEIKKRIGSIIRDIAISLLSRLFKSFDPISQSVDIREKLIAILKSPYSPSGAIPSREGGKRTREKDLWAKIDRITSIAELKTILAQLLINPQEITSLVLAAQAAGEAIYQTLSANLSL